MEEELFLSGTSYIESLTKAFKNLVDAGLKKGHSVEDKFEKLIELELDLAIMGAEKAKEKASKNKNNVRPIN